MLKLLVSASSNKGSIVLDCFCGSGTTLRAAKELGRKWVGIDQSEEAIKIALEKLTSKQKTLIMEEDFEYLEQVSMPMDKEIVIHYLKSESSQTISENEIVLG